MLYVDVTSIISTSYSSRSIVVRSRKELVVVKEVAVISGLTVVGVGLEGGTANFTATDALVKKQKKHRV